MDLIKLKQLKIIKINQINLNYSVMAIVIQPIILNHLKVDL